MANKIVILDSAKEEFEDIKRYVKKEFGDAVWNTVKAEYKTSIKQIKNWVVIHMFISTKRDFRTHLLKRLLNIA